MTSRPGGASLRRGFVRAPVPRSRPVTDSTPRPRRRASHIRTCSRLGASRSRYRFRCGSGAAVTKGCRRRRPTASVSPTSRRPPWTSSRTTPASPRSHSHRPAAPRCSWRVRARRSGRRALALAQARRTALLVAKSDSVAAKRFEVAYNRYVIGRITIDNLYIAQAEKDQALVEYVRGLRGYWAALYRLRGATLFDFAAGGPIRE